MHNQFIGALKRAYKNIDLEKAREDSRKVGTILFGSSVLGYLTDNITALETLFAFTLSTILWYFGVKKDET